MNHCDYVKCIIKGMELYFRTFALAENMSYQSGDIEWIMPLSNATGPSVVFRVVPDEKTVINQIDKLIPGLNTGAVPSVWVISPTSTPENIIDCLLSKGFKNLSNPEKPELGMALDIEMIPLISAINPELKVKKVNSPSEFKLWINVVNEALIGWSMLSIEHYHTWISCDGLSFYLAYCDGTPIATVLTIQDGDAASVEFVSTLKEYRNQGAATTVCMEALRELRNKGVKTVTLRSSNKAIPLYTKLGFKPYYEQILMSYQNN